MKYIRLLAVVALAGLMMAAVRPVDAAFRLRLDDGLGTGVVITDEGAGDGIVSPATGAVGTILYSGSIGSFNVTVTTGASKPVLGGVNNYAEMHLNNLSISTTSAGTLRVYLEDDGYSGGPDGPMSFLSKVGGVMTAPVGSTVTIHAYVDPTNAVAALGADQQPAGALGIPVVSIPGTNIDAHGPLGVTFGPGAFSTTAGAGFTKSGDYSITAFAEINFTGAGSISLDHGMETLPEPASMAIWSLIGGIGAVAGWRRRRKA